MVYQDIILDKQGGVATMTLNRPARLNAMSFRLMDEMKIAAAEVEKDNNVKVLIITGAGRAFCSGGDVREMQDIVDMSTGSGMTQRMLAFTLPLYNLSKPTIAAVNGVAAGGGFVIALFCDLRVASETAKFSLAYVKRGLIPDIGSSYLMPRLVGTTKAMEIMAFGDPIDAAEAFRLNLVNKVVPEQDVMKVAREYADRIANGPSLAINLIKKAIRRGIHNSFEEQVEWESYAIQECHKSEDHLEGIKSFLEKRPPKFKGK